MLGYTLVIISYLFSIVLRNPYIINIFISSRLYLDFYLVLYLDFLSRFVPRFLSVVLSRFYLDMYPDFNLDLYLDN